MGETVRIPDPVYSKVSREAERQDVARGIIIREWMEKAEKFKEMEARR